LEKCFSRPAGPTPPATPRIKLNQGKFIPGEAGHGVNTPWLREFGGCILSDMKQTPELNLAVNLVDRIKLGLAMVMLTVLAGCIGFVGGGPGYGGGWWGGGWWGGGGYGRGYDAHAYSARGAASRGAAHGGGGHGGGGRR
jgi:hypothetical protein